MDIVAIIACRNEESYLENCLRHLLANGISFAIIDHESSDGTVGLLKSPDLRKGLVHYQVLPFIGVFELRAQLDAKEALAERLAADWVIHHDADEVMHSYRQDETLHDAIVRLAAKGANVINFDEFVFLPVDNAYVPGAGPQPLCHYYFFEPSPCRLMRAWNRRDGLGMKRSSGHRRTGEGIHFADESLALRHYIFRSQMHAYQKYTLRLFSVYETRELGWHANRVNQPINRFGFPPASLLERLDSPASSALSKARPKAQHYWQWEDCRDRDGTADPVRKQATDRLARFAGP